MAQAHLTYVCDAGFSAPSIVSLHSALRHASRPVNATIFLTEPVPAMAGLLSALSQSFSGCQLECRPLPGFSVDLDDSGQHLTAATYGRLLLNREIDHRTVYLDGDTLVLGDICELCDADLHGNPIGAVRDYFIERQWTYARNRLFRKRKPGIEDLERMSAIMDIEHYFNAGLLVIDFGNPDVSEAIAEIFDLVAALEFHRTQQPTHWDQDWLNHKASGRVTLLGEEWNSMWGNPRSGRFPLSFARRRAYRASRTHPKLVHYVGSPKPWSAAQPSKGRGFVPSWELYQSHLQDALALLGTGLEDLFDRKNCATDLAGTDI